MTTARIFRAIPKGTACGLEEIKEEEFDDEKSIQTLIGKNIGVIFPNHELVKEEFALEGKKIDAVAFNVKTKSFVVIEYKKSKVRGVLEQTIDYLRLLEERGVDFLQQYNETYSKNFNKKDIAWDKGKAIIISPSFTEQQLSMAKGSKEPIELYQISKYKNGIMTFGRVAYQKQNNEPPFEEETSEERHLEKVSKKTRSVYNELKVKLFEEMPGTKLKPLKIVIKILNKHDKTVGAIEILKNSINLSYATNRLAVKQDDESFVKNMVRPKKIGNHGVGYYMSKIKSKEDVSRAIYYVRQVHNKKAKNTTSGQKRSGASRSAKQYSEEGYLKTHGSDVTRLLYSEFRDMLSTSIPGIKTKTTKRYIGWRSPTTSKLLCAVEVLKTSLKIIYNAKELSVTENDINFVEHMIKNGKEINMVGPGHYRSKINNREDVARAIPYIKDVHMQKVK